MRQPLQELRDDSYERPNQPWVCGLADAAGPCPLGPGMRGRCPAAAACQPVRDGDRWRCNRSPGRGGPCDEGPSPEGECCHVDRCTPVMSLRLKRGRFVVGCTFLALGALLIMLALAVYAGEVLRPKAVEARAEMRSLTEKSPNYPASQDKFRKLHARSAIINSAVFLLGIAILFINAYTNEE